MFAIKEPGSAVDTSRLAGLQRALDVSRNLHDIALTKIEVRIRPSVVGRDN